MELEARPAKQGTLVYTLKSLRVQLLYGPHPAKIDETDAPVPREKNRCSWGQAPTNRRKRPGDVSRPSGRNWVIWSSAVSTDYRSDSPSN